MTADPNPFVLDAAAVLIHHTRSDIGACSCGWAEWGKRHSIHVAEVLDLAGLLAKGVQQ